MPVMSKPISELFSELVVNKTWRIYRISALHGWKSDAQALKNFASALTAKLTAEVQSDLSATIKQLEFPDQGTTWIVITVFGDDSVGKRQMLGSVYIADSPPTPALTTGAAATGLHSASRPPPIARLTDDMRRIALVRGLASHFNCVLQWLSVTFDCSAATLSIPLHEMKKLAHALVHKSAEIAYLRHTNKRSGAGGVSVANLGAKSYEFVLAMPGSVDSAEAAASTSTGPVTSTISGITNITINFVGTEVRELYARLKATRTSSTNVMQLLESHISNQLRISIPSFNLVRFGSPLAFISNDGRMKLFGDIFGCLKSIQQALL